MPAPDDQRQRRGETLEGDARTAALREFRALPIVAGFSDQEFVVLGESVSLVSFRAGAIVLKHGEVATSCGVVMRGKLISRRLDPRGKELTLSVLGPGCIFGELALFTGGVRTADVVAEERSVVAEIPEKCFRRLLATNSSFSWQLLTTLAERVQVTSERLNDLSFLDLHQRLLHTLSRLATVVELDGESTWLVRELPSQQFLAGMLSCSREAVSRGLKLLEQQGAIVMHDDQVEINRVGMLLERYHSK